MTNTQHARLCAPVRYTHRVTVMVPFGILPIMVAYGVEQMGHLTLNLKHCTMQSANDKWGEVVSVPVARVGVAARTHLRESSGRCTGPA